MKRIVSLAMIVILPVFAFAASTSMNLSDALKKEIVKMEAINTKGNYKGKSVKLTVTNNSSSSIEIKVDLGIILKPANPAFQPLILSGEEVLTLKAHEKSEVDVEVFCDNSVKACPIEGLPYTFLRVGGDTLIRILRFIKDHSLFDHLGQSAVWAITNYLPLNNVYDRERDSLSRELISFIVNVTKRDRPTFYILTTDNETPAQPAYIGRTEKIYVPFNISLTSPGELTVGLYNSTGQLIKTVFGHKMFEQGTHNIIVEVDPGGMDNSSKYHVRLMDAEKTLQEKEIMLYP